MQAGLLVDERSSIEHQGDDSRWSASRMARLAPAVVPLVLAAVLCVEYDTPDLDVVRYLLAFVVSVVVPGTLVHRWLRGRQDLLVSDLSLGAATGLALQLLGWFVFTMLGISSWMWLWTVVLLVPFAAVPSLRRHATLSRYPKQVPLGVGWAMSALASALVWRVAHSWFEVAPLPLKSLMWYPDDYWHLASAAELQRSVLPRVPQVADLSFAYHWFANAHMGVMSTLTGIDLPVVVARLWVVPVLLVLVGLSVAVMAKLTGAVWPALVVTAFLLTSGNLNGVTWLGLDGVMALMQHSPSQVFSLIPMMLIIHVATDVLRGRPIGRGWALLFLILLFTAGSKSSVLPVLVGGALLAGAVALLRRDGWRRCASLAGAMVVAMVVMAPLVSGSSAGTGVQLFNMVRRFPVWGEVTGISPLEASVNTGPLIPGLGRPGAVTLLVLILLAYAVQYLWVLVALPLLSFRREGDLTAWFLLGTGVAGWWAMMLVDQDGVSQAYFMRGAVVALHVLGAWGLHRVWTRSAASLRHRGFAISALVGVALGWIVLEVATAWSTASVSAGSKAPPVALVDARLTVSLALVVAPFLIGLVLFWLLRRRGARAAVPVLVATTAALVLAPVIRPMIDLGSEVTYRPAPSLTISSSEVTAARWVAEHTPTRDVIATNLHCLKFATKPNCDARSFWVSGLAERAVLVEGWAYTEAAHQAHGRNGFSSRQQPFADAATFALNESAFAQPTSAGLDQLYARGVRWLYADRRASTVSPELATLADLRFRAGDADVYELRAP
ncbi:hypothetical protein N865_19805 [Intrasporangium oryzae NRRL B-24470]|uniref:Uncharacterized protein n=1 Tax=Intrasporangium oryzae NRRL B-24470 TaxID=1386089 RepID=W9G542_9MICO|nr:hypothetical protein [Intrasporangium oryzae]EWS99927.1 hypothetical protein N865_19805 [Intrasporangium oryzae NRRL B-24470]